MGNMMAPPQRTAEHDKLNFMVGEWKTREVHAPSPWMPQGGTGEGRATSRWGVGNMVLISDYASKASSGFGFEGHGLMTYDPNRKAYVSHWIDSMAPIGQESVGRFEEKDLILQSQCETPEGKMKMRMVAHPVSANEYTFTLDSEQGGKWATMMTITYVRV